MRKIYIILTHTGTVLSKIIKYYTKDEFSHVSIALDNELKEMYSFGRLHPSNPFFAGFVHEYIHKGTFKRFPKTVANVYSIEVDDNQFNNIKTIIYKMKNNSKHYKFNIIGLFAVSLHVRIKIKNYFYCAEFVKYLLEESGINTNLPDIIRPEDFKELPNGKKEYTGRLQDYCIDNEIRTIPKRTNSKMTNL